VSSALLYLAIVAIWALVLVPRWVRPRHSAPRTLASQQTLESHLTEPAWPRRVEDFAWADEGEAGQDGAAGQDEGASQEATADRDGAAGQDVTAGQEAAGHGGGAVATGPPAPPEARRARRGRDPSPAGQRASILRARRRALVALLLLTGGAVGIAVRHLAADWVVIPPTVMLAGFVLLLREAGRSDARRAGEIAARRHSAGALGRPVQSGAAGSIGQPEAATAPGAQIIDISARVGDQLYDQYADAQVRAVGD
jgi:hypothetical protein